MTKNAAEFINTMRNKINTQVVGSDLIEGQRIWVPGYRRDKYVPVELIVVNSSIPSLNRIQVAYVNQEDQDTFAVRQDYKSKASHIYLGDLGVRPYNYDKRQSQVFFTREALEVAIELWNGKNPNFLYV